MASAEEPLLADPDDEGGRDDASATADDGPEERLTGFVVLLTLSACISGLLFGYDTGVISATLISTGTSLSGRELTTLDKSLITSATALLALLASPLAGWLADARGRRSVILLSAALFAAGAAVQAASGTVAAMVAGRAVVGAAVGAASLVTPLYIAETAPARHRGRLVTLNVLFITAGQAVAYLTGWGLAAHGGPGAWRWMVGLGAAPAVVQAVLVAGMPETPRWLVRRGRSAEARRIVARVLGGRGDGAEAVVKRIEREVRQEEEESGRPGRGGGRSRPWDELFRVRRNRRALAVACLLQGLQQLCGFNSLMYFSATIFQMLGFAIPTLTSLTVAGTNLVFTALALAVIDRVGRRRVLLWSIPVMIAGLLLSAYGFSRVHLPATLAEPAADRGAARLILGSMMMYVAAYAVGLGNVPWMQSELFGLGARGLGGGLATATNWAANFVVGLTFLPLLGALTPSGTFTLYAAVCAAGLALVARFYPETAGLSLEEAATLLEGDGWGVR